MRKRIVSLLLTLFMLVNLCACGSKEAQYEEVEVDTALSPSVINYIEYTDSNTILRFSKTDGKWIWTDEPTFPLDASFIEDMLSRITTVQSLKGVSLPEEEDLGLYGLDQPSFTLTFSADAISKTFYFGTYSEDLKSYYMCDQDHTTLYEAECSIIDTIPTNVQDLAVIPSIPQIDESNVISMEFSHLLKDAEIVRGETFSAFYSEGSWISFGKDVSTPMGKVMEELKNLSFSQCVDFNPAEGATEVCGLTKPTFTVDISYRNSVNVKTVLTLTFGSFLESSSSYYVQMNKSGPIYTITGSSITKMLYVAQRGF